LWKITLQHAVEDNRRDRRRIQGMDGQSTDLRGLDGFHGTIIAKKRKEKLKN
jgi:hypothetical protein